jgi:hypothetical protein
MSASWACDGFLSTIGRISGQRGSGDGVIVTMLMIRAQRLILSVG